MHRIVSATLPHSSRSAQTFFDAPYRPGSQRSKSTGERTLTINICGEQEHETATKAIPRRISA